MPLKYLYVSYTGEEYVLINYSNTDIIPEVEAAILRIAKSFHENNIWQAANITAAL